MRSLDQLELDLSPGLDSDDSPVPTVLIGPNGAGKSTLLEACELLRKAATEHPFVSKLFDVHGGPPALLRRNAKRIVLGVECVVGSSTLSYEVSLYSAGMSLMISEVAQVQNAVVLERGGDKYRYLTSGGSGSMAEREIASDELALASAPPEVPMLSSIRALLASIEVHTPVEVRPPWAAGSSDAGPRASNVIRPATRVELGGRNLPNVYYTLRQQKDWPQTLERIQLALGDQIEDVLTPADPSGGRIGLAIRVVGLGEIPAFSMSDGQLSYLALVGVLRLHRPNPPLLVAFDEPDLHLHPSLARRLMSDLETFSRYTPVLVATQSDAMLDVLGDPARSSVLCELDEHHATQLVRPDQKGLQRWLEDYRGLGELRAAGYEGVVFPRLETP